MKHHLSCSMTKPTNDSPADSDQPGHPPKLGHLPSLISLCCALNGKLRSVQFDQSLHCAQLNGKLRSTQSDKSLCCALNGELRIQGSSC